ncbi:MAG: UDP-2,4-diacetamido-2,4,6-trideoxy-beta-L-altropyranose hydrolase [Candidatus Omnitrophica bacterium]|nr:UDP-2,4-diacetamido-2,4,6-trideoxy-beta-L-altropyranose hydrolase [Candidatus Omnitrophota bacterium]
MGHLTRCLSLCQAFSEKGFLPQLFVHSNEQIDVFLEGVEAKARPWFEQRRDLLKEIGKPDIVLIDSYVLDKEFYEQLSKTAALAIYIDDNMRLDYPQGIVVNGTIGAEKFAYPKKEGLIYLLGTQYTPLRKDFWTESESKIAEEVSSLLITFGGSDLSAMAFKVAEALAKTLPQLKLKVISNKGIQGKCLPGVDCIYELSAAGMRKAFEEADIVISASGQTLYELASLARPTIGVLVADNQLHNAEGFKTAGFIEYAGSWLDESVLENILLCLEKIYSYKERCRRQDIARSLIDGQGARRIAGFAYNLLEKCTAEKN